MGLIVSCFASCIASCAASCACGVCCSVCSSLSGSDSAHDVRRGSTSIKYFVLFTLAVVAAIVLRYRNNGVIHLYTVSWDACQSDACVGYEAVYRITFALFVFFLLHAFLLLFSALSRLDRVSWLWHYLLFAGLLVAAFAIPSPFYDQAWTNVARFLSFFFLFFQIVILIDFAYEWNESWTSDERPWFAAVLCCALLMLAGCVVLWTFYFLWFGGSGCGLERFLISWTIIECVSCTLLAISPLAEGNGGLLPAAVLCLYMTWLAYSGLESDPSSCNSIQSQDTTHLVLGLVLGALSIVYAAYNVSTSNTLFGGEEAAPDQEAVSKEQQPAPANGDIELASRGLPVNSASVPVSAPAAAVDDEANARLLARRNQRLHLLLALASAYTAMLVTNWGSAQQSSNGDGGQQVYDQGTESLFIKFATQWASWLTFVWALIAPKVLTGREFRTR